MTHEIKKSHDYAKRRKNKETKNSLLWNLHKNWLRLLGFMTVVGLLHAFGASFSAIVGIYLTYKVLRLMLTHIAGFSCENEKKRVKNHYF